MEQLKCHGGRDTHMNTDAHPNSSIFWPVEDPPSACLLKFLQNLHLLPCTLHANWVTEQKRFYLQSTKCYAIKSPKTDQGEHYPERQKYNFSYVLLPANIWLFTRAVARFELD